MKPVPLFVSQKGPLEAEKKEAFRTGAPFQIGKSLHQCPVFPLAALGMGLVVRVKAVLHVTAITPQILGLQLIRTLHA